MVMRIGRLVVIAALAAGTMVALEEAPMVGAETQHANNCHIGYVSGEWEAYGMLDAVAGWGTQDYGICPNRSLFIQKHGYLPIWGDQVNVADDFGWVLIKGNGECSGLGWESAWYFDFTVPCKAHDYCWDLVRAGFNGYVTRGDCDSAFNDLMSADCNNRSGAAGTLCWSQRSTYYNIVKNWFGPSASPAQVSLHTRHTYPAYWCVDIDWGSTANNVDVQQWPCHYGSNQKFRFYPIKNTPGYFTIRPVHAGTSTCIRKYGYAGYLADWAHQWSCNQDWISQRMKLVVASPEPSGWTYTIRNVGAGWCMDMPYSSQTAGDNYSFYGHCHEGLNQQFWIT